MAADLHCPNCEDNLGKDTENPAITSCGTCGHKNIFNERGDKDGLTEDELKLYNAKMRKKRGY